MYTHLKKISLEKWKEALLSLLLAVFCFFFVYFFPSEDYLQYLTKNFFFLLLIPFFYVKLVLKKDFQDFGLNLKNKKDGFLWGGLMFVFLAIVFFLLIRYLDFEKNYAPPFFVFSSYTYFLFYELLLMNSVFSLQQVFFSGFLISALRETLGPWSILVQATVFLFPVLILREYFLFLLPQALIFLLGGCLAYKTRSFFYSYIFGFLFLIVLDAYIIFINNQIL